MGGSSWCFDDQDHRLLGAAALMLDIPETLILNLAVSFLSGIFTSLTQSNSTRTKVKGSARQQWPIQAN